MKKPTINQVRPLCEALNARGVIVLAFSEDNIAGASYGETKRECAQVGETRAHLQFCGWRPVTRVALFVLRQ